MKRTFVGLLIIVSCLLEGCTRQASEQGQQTTVVFWHSFVASTIPAVDSLVRDFEREHPGIRLVAQYIPTGDGLVHKLITAVQSRTAPDVCWIHTDFLDKLVEADAILPLSPFLDGPAGLSPDEQRDIVPGLLEAGKLKNVQYALPMEATALALLYNKDAFARAGLPADHPPATWEELRAYTRRLTQDLDGDGRIDQYGFFVPVFPASGELNIWMTLQWMPFLWQAGGEEMRTDRSEMTFSSAAGVAALRLWKDLYDLQEFSTFGIAHDIAFASGKVAMVMDGPWNLPRYRAMRGIAWGVAALPAGPAGRATYVAGEQLAIFRQSRVPDSAWAFVKWVLEPRNQARFSIASGYLPVRLSVLKMKEYQEYLEKDPAMAAFVDQLHIGKGRTTPARHRVEINRALAEAIEQATLGKADPKKCLDAAAAKANALLTQE